MLKLEIPPTEIFDERDNTFKSRKGLSLSLEHSLVSVSKWESKWCVPFLSKNEKTPQEVIDYIKCMTLTQNVSDYIYFSLTEEHFKSVGDYIDAPMSATTIINRDSSPSREIITSEIIYYWMVSLNIPFECQKWHLNRLLMLINVCSIKQQDPKKLKGKALAKNNAALNAQRRATAKSRG